MKDLLHEFRIMMMFIGLTLTCRLLDCKASIKLKTFYDYKQKFMEFLLIHGIYMNGDLQLNKDESNIIRKFHYIIIQQKFIDYKINLLNILLFVIYDHILELQLYIFQILIIRILLLSEIKNKLFIKKKRKVN